MGSIDQRFVKITQLIQWKKYDLATTEVKNILSQEPNNAQALGLYALIELNLGNLRSSINLGKKSLAVAQNNPMIFLHLSDAYTQYYKYNKARKVTEQGLNLFPEDPLFHLQRAKQNYNIQRFEWALKNIEIGLSLEPNNVDLLNLKGLVLNNLNKSGDIEAIDSALSLDPLRSESFAVKGWFEFKKGNYLEAEKLFVEARKQNPENKVIEVAHIDTLRIIHSPSLGKLLFKIKQYKVAIFVLFGLFWFGYLVYTIYGMLFSENVNVLLFFLSFVGFSLIITIFNLLGANLNYQLSINENSKNYFHEKEEKEKLKTRWGGFAAFFLIFSILLYFYF